MAETCECGFKIRDTGHYPIICSCGRRYGEASALIAPAYRHERQAICDVCPMNDEGVCLDCKEKLPGKACLIQVAINNPRLRCKRNHWLAVSLNCPTCGILLQNPSGVDHCDACGWQGASNEPLLPPRGARM